MSVGEELKSQAAELMKKVLTVGIGGIFLTEESLRSLLSEFKLPKELLAGLFESANKTKNEFFAKLSGDVLDRMAGKLDPQQLVEEFLRKNEVNLQIRVSFSPKRRTKEMGAKEMGAKEMGAKEMGE